MAKLKNWILVFLILKYKLFYDLRYVQLRLHSQLTGQQFSLFQKV